MRTNFAEPDSSLPKQNFLKVSVWLSEKVQCKILFNWDDWKMVSSLDYGRQAAVVLTDLSKAFDCIDHELLIAKLNAYGFDNSSLTFI